MDLSLVGKTALLLGGSRGLGRAVAEAMAAEGVATAIVGRDRAALDETVAAIGRSGGRALGIAADIGDWPSLHDAAKTAQAQFGPIDIVLLNTGGPPATKASGVPAELWEEQYRQIVLPLIRLTDLLLPDMRARKWGRILYIAAPGIITPLPFVALAQSLRAAVANWAKALAAEVAPDGITVNTIIPGLIKTARMTEIAETRARQESRTMEAVIASMIADVPVGRIGTPAEFGAIATFLASPLAALITGSLIRVDGGWIRSL